MAWTTKFKKLGAQAKAEMRQRMDSWVNALSGLGTSRDKTTFTQPVLSPVLPPQTLEAIYHDDDIAARIVSAMPDECFREGFTVVNKSAQAEVNEYLQRNPHASPKDVAALTRQAMQKQPQDVQARANELQRDIDGFGTPQKFREAMTWGRLYGLGAILVGFNDGRDPWEPLDEENVQSIDYMTVLDKRDLTPWRWYADFQAPKFGDVAIYLMQPVGVYVDIVNTSQVLLVHESRMIRFGGELTSKRLRLANQGADYSVLQKAFRALQIVNDNWQSSSALLADASQAVFSIKGLIDMISTESTLMNERFAFMDMVRSTFRAIVLDAGDQDGPAETFTRVPTPFTGIPEMLEQSWTRLTAAARMPKQILLGEPPGGLNAGGTADANIRWWYDTVKATQKQNVQPQMERMLRAFAIAKGWNDPNDWSVVFPALWQLTAKEEADMHFSQAQADNLYITTGVATPEEIGLSRFGSGTYSLNTKIDTESRKRSMAATLATMEQEAANAQETAEDPAPTPGETAAQEQAAQKEPELPPRVNQT